MQWSVLSDNDKSKILINLKNKKIIKNDDIAFLNKIEYIKLWVILKFLLGFFWL